jgi:predicted kinase
MTLLIFGGLPAAGKSTIARSVTRTLRACYVRVDSIESAMVASGALTHPVGPVGYAVAYTFAAENLSFGGHVVADTVNPLLVTREAWRSVAVDAGVPYLDIEVICSDPVEHERRATDRSVTGQRKPTWAEITNHEYEPRTDEDRLVLDTALLGVDECIEMVLSRVLPASLD